MVFGLDNWKQRVAICSDGEDCRGIRLWRRSQQFDIEQIKMKMSVRHPSGEVEYIVGYMSLQFMRYKWYLKP